MPTTASSVGYLKALVGCEAIILGSLCVSLFLWPHKAISQLSKSPSLQEDTSAHFLVRMIAVEMLFAFVHSTYALFEKRERIIYHRAHVLSWIGRSAVLFWLSMSDSVLWNTSHVLWAAALSAFMAVLHIIGFMTVQPTTATTKSSSGEKVKKETRIDASSARKRPAKA